MVKSISEGDWEIIMLRTAFFLLFAGLPVSVLSLSAVSAQSVPAARAVDVELSSFAFAPETIELEAGKNYILRLNNISGGGHSFGAPTFFAAVTVAADDQRRITKGRIEIPAGETVEIRFKTGRAGEFKLKCTHFLHSGFGMNGRILVK
jgi:uncharacterized cupredoxin-like copper-binding protein